MPYIIEGKTNAGTSDAYSVSDYRKAVAEAMKYAEYADGKSGYRITEVSVVNRANGLEVWNSNDPPELKKYEAYSNEDWSVLLHGHHKQSEAPSVYFDIDGTLGYWYSDGRGLPIEEIVNPVNHYFRDIEPHEGMIDLAKRLYEGGADVCIISAAEKDTIRDKWEWIDRHLPFVPKENICFSPIGADKSEFVKGNAPISILIDDYNKNLEEWKGVSVKAINTVNSHQEKFREIDFTKIEPLLKNMPEQSAFTSAHREIERNAEAIRTILFDLLKNEKENFKVDEKETKELASDIEQFMFERGEYDFSDSDRIRWLEDIKEPYSLASDRSELTSARETVQENIEKALSDPLGKEALVNYLRDEFAVMESEDELIEKIPDLIERITTVQVMDNDITVGSYRSEDPYYKSDDKGAYVEFSMQMDDASYEKFANRTDIIAESGYESFDELLESDDYLNVYVSVYEDNTVTAVIATSDGGSHYDVPLTEDEQEFLQVMIADDCQRYEKLSLDEMIAEAKEEFKEEQSYIQNDKQKSGKSEVKGGKKNKDDIDR